MSTKTLFTVVKSSLKACSGWLLRWWYPWDGGPEESTPVFYWVYRGHIHKHWNIYWSSNFYIYSGYLLGISPFKGLLSSKSLK